MARLIAKEDAQAILAMRGHPDNEILAYGFQALIQGKPAVRDVCVRILEERRRRRSLGISTN